MDGVYEPIDIERLSEDILQGHSDVLDLDIRWNDGRLEWYDPETGHHIATFDDERVGRVKAEARVDDERARADDERVARVKAEARVDDERAARLQAEARNRELEEELRRLRGE